MIRFVTVEWVVWLHDEQIAEHGGTHGLRDQGALESAVATPQASFGGEYLHQTLWDMAAAYAFHIAENQPFLDGNKRTAFATALVFLKLNGVDLDDPDERLYDAMLAVGSRRLDKAGMANLLRELSGNQVS